MKKSENKIHVLLKARVSSALLFSLAFLLLIVSCPLKRFLKDSFSVTTTSATTSNQAHRNHKIANYSNVVNNCQVSEKPVSTIDFSQVKLQAPQYFQNIINRPGYNTHYFLSRISYNYNSSSRSLNSSLPLFLQHLRFLI